MSKIKKVGSALVTAGKGAEYVVTLGGSKAVKEAKKNLEVSYAAYQNLHGKLTKIETETENILKSIGTTLSSVQPTLTFSQNTLRQSNSKLKPNMSRAQTLEKLHSFKASYNSALTAGFGISVGGAGAVGAWAVVSMVGSASTGAAISSLSGVAAFNATLAWFGGGALACLLYTSPSPRD